MAARLPARIYFCTPGGVGVVVLVVVVVNKTGWDSLMLVQSPRAIKLGKAPLVLIGIEL